MNRKQNYFEGWYYKLIDEPRKNVLAVIPGISIGESLQDAHAFIQVIDAIKSKSEYYRFPYGEFHTDKRNLNFQIGPNEFSDHELKIDLGCSSSKIGGNLSFNNMVKYPKSFLNPGIMGPFSFIPGMECYHGIVNISNRISGALTINGQQIDMTNGEGYIEKDWGRSFPKSWIWLQANHFEGNKGTFMFSIACIPWLGKSFTGFLSFLKTEDRFYKFATYNGSKRKQIRFKEDILEVSLENSQYTLDFTAKYSKGGILKAPKNGLMERDIEETITAEVTLHLYSSQKQTIFLGGSKFVGMEIAGSLDDIL
jgi:hypothetical protein